jgi:hypothetical protein
MFLTMSRSPCSDPRHTWPGELSALHLLLLFAVATYAQDARVVEDRLILVACDAALPVHRELSTSTNGRLPAGAVVTVIGVGPSDGSHLDVGRLRRGALSSARSQRSVERVAVLGTAVISASSKSIGAAFNLTATKRKTIRGYYKSLCP